MAVTNPPLHHAQPTPSTLNSALFPSHDNGAVIFRFRNFPPSHSLSFSSPQCSSRQQPRRRIPRVSTAPGVECAPPAPDFDFQLEIARLRGIRGRISSAVTLGRRHEVLDSDYKVNRFFNFNKAWLDRVLEAAELDSYDVYLIKCLVAAGQEHVLTYGLELGAEKELEPVSVRSSLKSALYALAEMIESWDGNGGGGIGGVNFWFKKGGSLKEEEVGALKNFLKTMREVEKFYDCIGGIIGYQISVLQLLAEAPSQHKINGSQHVNESLKCDYLEIHSPRGVDISKNTEYASQAALWGIKGLPDLGEIYPLGGSADRLGLVDPITGECLPAAMLPFCGRTLLEGLIRDLQAREFLYFKIYGKQCITPVAIMTSAAKNNHERVTSLCERLNWFGRGRSSFKLFEQPLVPAISASNGGWLVAEPFTPVCKPGGHGVIWKLAHDTGVFKWFYSQGRRGATVRQVSNVVAATDLTLLALAGIGLHHNKKLGFASCKRTSGATEGINVLMERMEHDGKWAYGLSCVEYTEFDKFGISNGTHHPHNNAQAEFPANTNILYIDLRSVESVASSNDQTSLPGLVLNIKKPIVYMDHFGIRRSVSGGRLECTMQNIADNLCNTYLRRCYKEIEDELDTYIVYNERRRVTSSAKKKRRLGDMSLHQTPDGALLDITRNAYDLLSQSNIWMPEIGGNNEYIESGPPYLIFLHPALGPLWEVTRQKFQGGSISKGAELQVEVAEFYWRDVQLDGSMIISAENAMGEVKSDSNGKSILQYGHRCPRCKLQNVRVVNRGINWESGENIYWKNQVQRHESLKIVLHGNSEFDASDVTIEGDHLFELQFRWFIYAIRPNQRSYGRQWKLVLELQG
ncbi:hypothetical protein V2J09_003488 [Rumex salicifolius]